MKVVRIYNNTYKIMEFGPFGIVSSYLLIGTNNALLIDCGYGKGDIKKVVSKLTNKELVVILTHGHVDHANGLINDITYLDSSDFEVYRLHSSDDFINTYYKRINFKKKVFPLNFDEIDIGDRII